MELMSISFKCVKLLNIITSRSWKFTVTTVVSKWFTKSHSPFYDIPQCQYAVKFFLQIILCYQFYTFLEPVSALLIPRSISIDGTQLTSASARCKESSTGEALQPCIQPLTLFLESWYENGAHPSLGNKNVQTEHKLCY